MAVKAAAGGQSTGRWYCQQMESGQRILVGADDTTLQAPWDQGPAASLAGYRYAIFSKYTVESCFEPPTKGAPDGTVEGATQQLGAQPASPAEFHNAGTQSEVLYDDALTVMNAQSTPAVRAAAYRLLASLPGIRMKPNVQDPAGQSGTAVWLSQAGPTLGLTIVNPATGTLLCIEDVAQQPVAHVAVGTVIDYTLFVSSGWTNTPPSS
jgi:hypothetical protein